MSVNRSVSSRTHRGLRASVVPGETELAHAARQLAIDVMRHIDVYATLAEAWWKKQLPRTRVGLAIIAVVLAASFLNVVEMQIARGSSSQPTQAASTAAGLSSESAPIDAGKMWSVVKMWSGTGTHDTEVFTVGDHWRVDWLFNESQSLGQLQVYVYSADGKLLNVAANTQKSGADTSFWMGPGTYMLRINAFGGDWKLDVQDLH